MIRVRLFSVVLALVVSGWLVFFNHVLPVSAALWPALRQPKQTVTQSVARFLPRQGVAAALLRVSPKQLDRLRPGGLEATDFQQLRQGLLAGTDLDYDRDIQPWMGDEMAVALTTLDLDHNSANGRQPGYLLVAKLQNGIPARKFLQAFWQKRATAGAELQFEQYQGVSMIYDQQVMSHPAQPRPLLFSHQATAVVGQQYLLLANHPKVLREAINTAQAIELSLAEDKIYQQSLATIAQDTLAIAFVNWPHQPPLENTPAAPARLVISLTPDKRALRLETLFWPSLRQEKLPAIPTIDRLPVSLRYLPAESPFVLTGSDLAQIWTGWGNRLTHWHPLVSILPIWDETIWSETVLPALQGDYALAAFPRGQTGDLDWVAIVPRSPDVIKMLQQLDQRAIAQGLTIGPVEVADQSVLAWTKLTAQPVTPASDLSAQLQAVHTTLDNSEVFATSLDALAFVLRRSTTLLNAPAFKAAVNILPLPHQGYVYLNWPASRSWLVQKIPALRVLELLASPLLDRFQALTLSSSHLSSQYFYGQWVLQWQ